MFTTNPVLLTKLFDDVEAGKIQLPDFQRGWVWDDDRIIGLLASISRGFPVGAIMTLSSGDHIRLKTRPVEGVSELSVDAPDAFLLDGQQRLTSLYQALRHPGPVDTNDSRRQKVKRRYYVDMQAALDPTVDREDAIISVPENRIVTEDFGRITVRDLSTSEHEYRQHMIPTERLMETMDWMWEYLDYWDTADEPHPQGNARQFFQRFQTVVLARFKDYQLPVITLDKDTPKEAVCTVFEKVNTGGVTLNVFELATASFAADADSFSLRDDWEARKRRMYSFSGVLQGIQGDHFLQAVSLLKTQGDRRSAIRAGTAEGQAPAVSAKSEIFSTLISLTIANGQRK